MKIKFWSTKNTEAGFKILLATIITSLIFFLGFLLVSWLFTVKTMFILGIIIGIGLFFFYYHTLGYVWRKWFK